MKPSPAPDVCYIVEHIHRRDGVYPRPTNSGQDTKQMTRSSEGGDKPHPFYVANQTIDFYLFFFNSDYQHFSICCTFV